MSVSRLRRKMGQLSAGDYGKVYEGFMELLTEGKKIRPRLLWGRAGISRKSVFIVAKIWRGVKRLFCRGR